MARSTTPVRGSHLHLGWPRLGALFIAVALLGACGASATQSPASPSPTALSPTANPDEALVADLSALMSDPYDAARVAALYAPNAVIHETTANLTQTGLEQIGARIREFNDGGFKTVVASAPIRQGNFVAVFAKYGTGGDLSNGALVVLELEGGKVLNHWVYPAP